MNATLQTKPNNLNNTTSQSVSDEALLAHYCATGDRAIFAQLVGRYERELFRYLSRYLNDAEMAEDAFQTTFLQVHLKRDKFEAGRRFRPWLYAIATNQAIDARRREKRHRLVSLDRTSDEDSNGGGLIDMLVGDGNDPFEHANSMETKERVLEQLDKLPSHLRAVVQLVYFDDMKYREAAEHLDVPVGTVKSRLHTAINRLTDAWDKRI